MLHRRNRKATEPQPEEDERGVSENLYGSHTRSGHVRLTPLFPDEFGRIAGLSEDWTEWDRISWKDQRHSVRV